MFNLLDKYFRYDSKYAIDGLIEFFLFMTPLGFLVS